jgi:carboxypeptidase family protein
MFTKSLQMGFVGLVLSVATAWAGPSVIQGVVKDAKGQAIKGADVRIESRDGKKLFKTVKTDGSGHYVSDGLAAGMYRVTLVVNGAMKASIMNTQTKADQRTQLNFDLKAAAPSQVSASAKSGKHMVWVPSSTGSHIGGRWVEVPEGGSADSDALNLKRGSAEALHRTQMQNAGGPGSVPGGSTTGP